MAKVRYSKEQLFKKAETGNADAMYSIGYRYMEGIGGLPKDLGKANEWFAKSAAAGAKNASVMLEKLQSNQYDQTDTAISQSAYSNKLPYHSTQTSPSAADGGLPILTIMFTAIVFFIWIALKIESNRKRVEIKNIENMNQCVNAYIDTQTSCHIAPLSLKRKQTVKHDAYGNIQDNKWKSEIDYFIENVLKRDYDLSQLLELQDNLSRNDLFLNQFKKKLGASAFNVWAQLPNYSEMRVRII